MGISRNIAALSDFREVEDLGLYLGVPFFERVIESTNISSLLTRFVLSWATGSSISYPLMGELCL